MLITNLTFDLPLKWSQFIDTDLISGGVVEIYNGPVAYLVVVFACSTIANTDAMIIMIIVIIMVMIVMINTDTMIVWPRFGATVGCVLPDFNLSQVSDFCRCYS